jgi:hypothetical protein
MLTVWPVDDPDDKGAKNDDCSFVVDHYDLFGGLSAIQDARIQGVTLLGQGPFLIGWSPSKTRGLPDKIVLAIDLSSYNEQSSLNEMFMFWQQKIVQVPTLWRGGFSLEPIRLVIKEFADRYGQDIIDSIKYTKTAQK